MELMLERCAGVDIGKSEVVACVRGPSGAGSGRRNETRKFSSFTSQLEVMADWFASEGVTAVVMEATGSYWKPVWYVLEERGFELTLVNARHVKMLPSRKTDVGDAQWLAELFEHGMLRGSFVPPTAIRESDAGIKLDSVASDVLGVSGRAMLAALVAGERDPVVLADLAKGVLRKKIPELREALRGRFREHHALLIGLCLEHAAYLEDAIARLDTEVDRVIAPFVEARDHLDSITGVGKRSAECIIAEIGVDMTVFPTAGHLASWAGRCPGNNITGGKRRSGKTNKPNTWLADTLTERAWSAARSRDTYLAAQYWRLSRRIGEKKAAVAVGHSILVICWHLLNNNCDYDDLGGDWFARRTDTTKRREHLVRQLQDLGYGVTLTNLAA